MKFTEKDLHFPFFAVNIVGRKVKTSHSFPKLGLAISLTITPSEWKDFQHSQEDFLLLADYETPVCQTIVTASILGSMVGSGRLPQSRFPFMVIWTHQSP
ncbi:MAG: hypothetical protein ABSE06_12600 [Anaerolineaceae bacterium]